MRNKVIYVCMWVKSAERRAELYGKLDVGEYAIVVAA